MILFYRGFVAFVLGLHALDRGGVPQRAHESVPKSEPLVLSGRARDGEWGGLSGLFYSRRDSTPQVAAIYAVTDRGPNGEAQPSNSFPGEMQRAFLQPAYSPRIIRLNFRADDRSLRVAEVVALKRPDGSAATGLPPGPHTFGRPKAEEIPVGPNNEKLNFDPWGVDTEAIAQDEEGNFWLCEEYGPSLLKVSAQGRIEKRWTPGGDRPALPQFLLRRRLNRGFEAMAWTARGTLLLFLQSPVPGVGRSDLVPVVEFDVRKEKTVGLYFYPVSPDGGKIGDAVTLPDGRVAVIEQNGKTGELAWQKVIAVKVPADANVLGQAEAAGDAYEPSANVSRLNKEELVDLSTAGLSGYEKLEGLARLPNGDFVLVNDNDFGVVKKEESRLTLVPAPKP
jgi:hypothetical protein